MLIMDIAKLVITSRNTCLTINAVLVVTNGIVPPLTVSYLECQKDATYITVSSRPTPESEPGARIVKSMSLRAAIAKGQIVRLDEGGRPGEPVKPSTLEVNKFFKTLSFKQQVRERVVTQMLDSQIHSLRPGKCLFTALSPSDEPGLALMGLT